MRLALLSAALLLAACASQKPRPTGEPTETSDSQPQGEGASESVSSAIAPLESKSGTQAGGMATFTAREGQVTLELMVDNAPPGTHAVHLHETGDCSAQDASSAGGHWNPTGAPHGRFGENGFHLGDIGNVEIASDGTGRLTFTTEHWTLGGGGEHDILGKAVLVHAAADDFDTQPSGGAGARIACGVIQAQ